MATHPLCELTSATPAVYSIPPDQPFVVTLARTLFDRYQDQPDNLSDITIWLPTRRAVRGLADAFGQLARQTGRPLFLPAIRTIGDAEEEATEALVDAGGAALPPPPASSLFRRLFLARLVHARDKSAKGPDNASWTSALLDADTLGQLLDSLYTEEVSADQLASIDVGDMAVHWQGALAFLNIALEAWPMELAARNQCDSADFRRRMISSLADRLADSPRGKPMILAGSTGSMPAVGRMMATIARHPDGLVILPGFDKGMDEAAWKSMDDAHPQSGMKHLLIRHFDELPRESVREWPASHGASARTRLLDLVLRPAEATDDWLVRLKTYQSAYDINEAVSGLSLVEADNEEAEAEAIAFLLRETLEHPDKTAMLVAPDRILARRVSAKMRRWGITIDDSAGVPLAGTLRGNYLRLIARWMEAPTDPVTLMALLRHPLTRLGRTGSDIATIVNRLDHHLRGIGFTATFTQLRQRLSLGDQWDAVDPTEVRSRVSAEILAFLDELSDLSETIPAPDAGFPAWLTTHIDLAERLAATTDAERTIPGADILWQKADGIAAATVLSELMAVAENVPFQQGDAYHDLFLSLLTGTPVRPRRANHPQLQILGPLEARLLQADLVILGGLNEGSWPDGAVTDPFLSRPMRKMAGLPSPERRIGLAAHDFAQLGASPDVVLTRSRNADRAPTTASRWLIRLKNILKKTGLLQDCDRTAQLAGWQRAHRNGLTVRPAIKPAPVPPVTARPRHLSVTRIERLLRDPYDIYASKILKLRKMDPLSAEVTPALRGRFYHALLARGARMLTEGHTEDLAKSMEAEAMGLLEAASISRNIRTLWHTDILFAINLFVREISAMIDRGEQVRLVEESGQTTFQTPAGDFTLSAKTDRIDLLADGSLRLVDYKTGTLPTKKQAKVFAPQLELTGFIAEAGGFAEIGERRIHETIYQKILNLSDRETANLTCMRQPELGSAIAHARERTIDLISYFDDPTTTYPSQPRPFMQSDYGDFDHLARRPEWAKQGGEDE